MIRTMLWLLTIAGSLFGGFVGVVGVLSAKGAPQEAFAAAIAVACAVIPYCLNRPDNVRFATTVQLTRPVRGRHAMPLEESSMKAVVIGESSGATMEQIMAVYLATKPSSTALLRRGSYSNSGDFVHASVMSNNLDWTNLLKELEAAFRDCGYRFRHFRLESAP